MMLEKFLVATATAVSALAFMVCVVVIPDLYKTINEVHAEVLDGVSVFRVETDSAWIDMMDVQIMVTPPSKPRDNPFDSIFRQKRQDFSGLPAWCQCVPPKPNCPLGPAGPPGEAGSPGNPGPPGPPGEDHTATYAPLTCPPLDTSCIKCPPGAPGPTGSAGPLGQPGPSGQPGQPGTPGKDGHPGPAGPPGDAGSPGNPGPAGSPGGPGNDGTRGHGKPGAAGPQGPPGPSGKPGSSGNNGKEGPAGPQGAPGSGGNPGSKAKDGQPGQLGNHGMPGNDAEYCPCPKRNAVYVPPPSAEQPQHAYVPPQGPERSPAYSTGSRAFFERLL